MKICMNCGCAAEGNFCPNCGSLLSEVEYNGPAPSAPSQPQPQSKDRNTFALVGFILSFVSSILGLIFSILAYRQLKDTPCTDRNFALAGIIISSVSIALALILVIVYIMIFLGMFMFLPLY